MEQLPEEEYFLWDTPWEATQADRKKEESRQHKQTANTGTAGSGYHFRPLAQVGKHHARNCKVKTKKRAKRHALPMSGLVFTQS